MQGTISSLGGFQDKRNRGVVDGMSLMMLAVFASQWLCFMVRLQKFSLLSSVY